MSFTLAPFISNRIVDDVLYCDLCLKMRNDVLSCTRCDIDVCCVCAVSRLLKYARCPQCKDFLTATEMKTSRLALKDKLSAFTTSSSKKKQNDNKNKFELDLSGVSDKNWGQDSLYFQDLIGLSNAGPKILYHKQFERKFNINKSKLNMYGTLDAMNNEEYHSQMFDRWSKTDSMALKHNAESINQSKLKTRKLNELGVFDSGNDQNSSFLQHFGEMRNRVPNALNNNRVEHIHYRQYTMTEFDKSEMTNMKCYQELHYQNFGEPPERYTNFVEQKVFKKPHKSKRHRTEKSKIDTSDSESNHEQFFEACSEFPETHATVLYQSESENVYQGKSIQPSSKSKNALLGIRDMKPKEELCWQSQGIIFQTDTEGWKNSGYEYFCKSNEDKPELKKSDFSARKCKPNFLHIQPSCSMSYTQPQASKKCNTAHKKIRSKTKLDTFEMPWDGLYETDTQFVEETDMKKTRYDYSKIQKSELNSSDVLSNSQSINVEMLKEDDKISTEGTEDLEQNVCKNQATLKFQPIITQVFSILELYFQKMKPSKVLELRNCGDVITHYTNSVLVRMKKRISRFYILCILFFSIVH